MSKVLVDRELLERCVDRWACCAIAETPGAEQAWLELRAVVKAAQPAEAEGVELVPFWVLFDATTPEPLIKKHMPEGVLAFFDNEEDARRAKALHPGTDYKRAPYVRAAALSAVTAERDRLQRNLKFTEQWYAERFERLADLGKSAGCWDAMAAIIANGTADPYEPPTYAQQLVRANHRADVAERERDQLRAEVEALREKAGKYATIERVMKMLECDEREGGIWTACTLLLIGSAHKMNSAKSVVDQEGVTVAAENLGNWRVTVERIDVAMAAKEA